MAKLAINGHPTRGKEVIEILEMLGGRNPTKLQGNASSCGYYIDSDGNIAYRYSLNEFIQFTIEEFLERFPYKIGDRVQSKGGALNSEIYIIKSMEWNNFIGQIYYTIKTTDGIVNQYKWTAQEFMFHKEEIMEENTDVALAPDLKGEDYSDRRFGYKIPKGYEFECVRNNEIILKPIKPQYPKTYEECAQILLERASVRNDIGHKGDLLIALQRLLVCRDAYWKIAGKQMGLGEPWEPRCDDGYQRKWIIFCQNGINFTNCFKGHFVLAFPTPEIRDTFYENFKELIELCKELL